MRALVAREAEFNSNEETLRQATVRRVSLQAAITDLRTTIADMIGDEDVPADVMARATPEVRRLDPQRAMAKGTLLARVLAYIDGLPRVIEATEISQALGIGIDSARTVLSKLKARGQIERLEPGSYCSLAYAHETRCEPEVP